MKKQRLQEVSGHSLIFGFTLILVFLGELPMIVAQTGFQVSGSVTDSDGETIPNIRVRIYDDDLFPEPDDLLATVYTDGNGNYSATITGGYGTEPPDVYILVDWYFQLLPPGDYNNQHIILVAKAPDPVVTFTEKPSGVVENHNPNTNLILPPLAMDQAQGIFSLTSGPLVFSGKAIIAKLRLHINEALDFYKDNKGSVPWSVNYDVPVSISLMANGRSFHQTGSITIRASHIVGQNIPNIGAGFVSTIYHEIAHLVQYRFYGNFLPPHEFVIHEWYTESEPVFAFLEGWASHVADLTSSVYRQDKSHELYRDNGDQFNPYHKVNTNWRGDEIIIDPNTGTLIQPGTGRNAAGFFESGEFVEGAVAGFWYGLYDEEVFTFEDVFRVIVQKKPHNVFEFTRGFVELVGGPGTDAARRMYEAMQRHGIVYNRLKFAREPFDETGPPDVGPPSEGNIKEIEGNMFLRGTVTIKYLEVSEIELGVLNSHFVNNKSVKIGYKQPGDDLNDSPSSFPLSQFTNFEDFNFSRFIDVDTRKFGSNSGNGDWDLVVVAENEHGFVDNFLPTWEGDPDPTQTVNTDEKYLKVLGAWYDKDRDPATNTVKEGKVIVDNTAPTVSKFKLK